MQGHCLVVGFQFSWWHLISTMRSTLRKTLGKKKHHRSTKVCGWNYQLFYGGQILIVSCTFVFLLKAPAVNGDNPQDKQQLPSKRKYPGRPKLLKRYTFQETSANTYAINNLEYNLEGEVVLSSAAKAMFAFQTEPEATIHGPTEFNIDLASIII